MQKKICHFLTLLLLLQNLTVSAQTGASEGNLFTVERDKFLRQLKEFAVDTSIAYPLSRSLQPEINNIYSAIQAEEGISLEEKNKAVRSLVYFMKEHSRNMEQHKFDLYELPGSLQSYKKVLSALMQHKPVYPVMVPLSPQRSQLLAATFSQYKEYALLDDIAVYKRVASAPEFILQFLENKPGFRFADSLILEAAANNPLKLIAYLNNASTPRVQERIRSIDNNYLKQIVSLSTDKNASELMPFVIQLAESKITPEEIVGTRSEVAKYFQLLVNTLQQSITEQNNSSIFLNTLRNGIRQKSLSFYVDQVNDLHNAKDPVRFASVKGLRPEDLYYIITSGGDELYTSSYLGLYKRLMENFKGQTADSLFGIVQYDNFRKFIQLAANYNVLADFLGKMPREKVQEVLARVITGIEDNTNDGLEQAMDIADVFAGLGPASEYNDIVEAELNNNLGKSRTGKHYLGVRLYNILLQVFDLVKHRDAGNKLWKTLGNYDLLKRDALENKQGEVVQLVMFYGDEDGVASYASFLKLYGDTSKWQISKTPNWINIRSVSEKPITIFANLPLDSKDELDLRAQDTLSMYLQEQLLQPAVLIHRGHSYHLDKTLKKLSPSVKLAILGSCGGYNKAISIATINPDVQVIGSKKTGAKSINDPIISVINDNLLSYQDLAWPEIWTTLKTRFSKDEAVLALFNEYFTPSENVSLFVLKLFMYYNRVV